MAKPLLLDVEQKDRATNIKVTTAVDEGPGLTQLGEELEEALNLALASAGRRIILDLAATAHGKFFSSTLGKLITFSRKCKNASGGAVKLVLLNVPTVLMDALHFTKMLEHGIFIVAQTHEEALTK